MKLRDSGVVLALCFFASASWAGGLSAPFFYDSAKVLPKGVRNIRLNGVTTEAMHTFNEVAAPVSLGNGFNREISYHDLLKNLSPSEQAEYGGYLKSQNIDEGSTIGETQGSIAARVTATIPAIAYGVSDRWTVGVGIPVIYSNISVSTGFIANAGLMKVFNGLGQKDPGALQSASGKMQQLVQTMASMKHYDPIQNQEKTEIGDVNLVSKYQFVKTEQYAVAVTNTLVLPTGRRANINKVVDIGSGDGDFKTSIGSAVDYYVLPKVTLTGGVAYLAQLPDQLPMRIPESRNDTMTSDIDETVYRDLGDIMRTSAYVSYAPTTEWTLQTGYTYQYKAPDRYRGAAYTPDRYALLEEKTDQTMQAAQVGISFNTISMYRRQTFQAPLEVGVNYTSVYDGRNIVRDSLTSAELSMYF